MPGGLLGADYSRRERPLSLQEGVRRPQLESAAARAADRARRQRSCRRVSAWRCAAATCARPANLYSFFENTAGQDRRAHRRPQRRRHRIAHRAGRADRERGGTAQSRLGRGQPAQGGCGDRRDASRTSTCPTPREPGYTYFKRYFYPQTHKDAVIIDERFNGGGQVADYYIDLLRRPLISYWAMRYGDDLKTPAASIQGPKVMIIDETAGLGRRPAAVDVPQVRASGRSSASGRGAASSASSVSRR